MYIKIIILFIYTIISVSCIVYGRPESIFVNFVGHDMEIFLEYEKIGKVSIDKNYKLIYLKKLMIFMKEQVNLGMRHI